MAGMNASNVFTRISWFHLILNMLILKVGPNKTLPSIIRYVSVNGEWSNWSSWSQCQGRCGMGIQSRSRTCSEPAPTYGGHLCRGSSKERRTCTMPFVDDGDPCPGISISGVGATWSAWSEWSQCNPDCAAFNSASASPDSENGQRRRTRNCLITRKDGGMVPAQSLRECDGHAEEVERCYLPSESLVECAGGFVASFDAFVIFFIAIDFILWPSKLNVSRNPLLICLMG